ncbi:MAG: hypothetical protein GY913_25220 [Proteobacteria bacterium]|nr:hypothetical protein [Pseudomonadota bacterium]MCP4920215.1 hypothetical protein [Pseudomonadota bacterium]
MTQPFIDDAAEIIDGTSSMLVTCEHASHRVPEPLTFSADDEAILQTHWGWDIGAAELVRAVCSLTSSSAVLARFSRLVCDANREVDDPTWILGDIEGHRLSFNRRVSPDERARRLASYHVPYHSTVDVALSLLGPDAFLLAVHTFTPTYRGEARDMDVGVLFDSYPEEAERLRAALAGEGLACVLNQPYSGLDGLMYSATRHGRGHGVRYLELEVRQDLLADTGAVSLMASQLTQALERSGLLL